MENCIKVFFCFSIMAFNGIAVYFVVIRSSTKIQYNGECCELICTPITKILLKLTNIQQKEIVLINSLTSNII